MAYTLGDIGNAPGQVYDFLKRKYVSLTTPDEEGDYSSRKGSISRQQKLAEALSQMGAQEQAVSTAGGITAPVSGMGALARGLTSFGGAYLSGKAAADAEALDKASRAAAREARKSYDTVPGFEGGTYKLDEPATAPQPNNMLTPEVAQDPSKLQMRDVNTRIPEIKIGAFNLGARSAEDKANLLDEFAMSDNPYLVSLSERIAAKEKPEFVPGDKEGIYRRVGDELVNVVKPRPDAADVPAASTLSKLQRERASLIAGGANNDDPLVRQYDAAINLETTRAPGVSISMGNKTDSVLSDLYRDDLTTLRTKKDSAQNILSIIGDIRAIPPGKLYSGAIADLKTTAGSYLEAIGLGGVDNDKIANSQEYQAKIADLGISKIKGALGVNPTDRDLEYVKMTLPLLTKVPAARARLLDLLEKRANTDIGNYRSATTHFRKYNNLDEWLPPGSRTATGIPTQGF